jgi:arylsulfatase
VFRTSLTCAWTRWRRWTPETHEWGYAGRKFLAEKLWAPTAAGPFLAARLQSLNEFPPSQGADTFSMKKAVDSAMAKVSKHVGE